MKRHTAFAAVLILVLGSAILSAQEEDDGPYLTDDDIASLEAALPDDVPADPQAAGIDPNSALAYYNRGKEDSQKGDYALAIEDYTQAIGIDPNDARAYNNRGVAYEKTGDLDKAIEDYTQAIELDPNNAWAYGNRASAYFARAERDPEAAVYASASMARARSALTDMRNEAAAERYDSAKAYAEEVIRAAEKAMADGKARAQRENLLSQDSMPREEMVGFLLKNNHALEKRRNWVNNLIDIYIVEAGREGVSYEIAFAQMCYHTNYLKFENTFAGAGTNNFCGISSLTSSKKAHSFESTQIGVKAHIQHLKGYASSEPLIGNCVDPRYQNIGKASGFGSAVTIDGLSGKWAGADYAMKIKRILNALYDLE